MNKKIIQAVVAGGMMINTMGNMALVSAYDGQSVYKENGLYGIIVTMVDERNDQVSLYFSEPGNARAVLKGVKLFNGNLHDNAMHAVNFTEAPWTTEYLSTSMYDEDFSEMVVGEERTFNISSDLATSDVKAMGMIHMFWNNAEDKSMYIVWGRMNYSRCAESVVYQENEGVICRVERWEDGELHYQPYEGWKRLRLPDETEEERQIKVFKDGGWVSETINKVELEEETEEPGEGIGAGFESGTEVGSGENSEVGLEEETKVGPEEEVGEKTVEVPAEKIIEEEVIKEVPIEKRVVETVEVQVPVEKTVVDVREVIREVPVDRQELFTDASWGSGTLAMAELSNDEEEDAENGDEDADTDTEESVSGEVKSAEIIEIPELGKEVSRDDNSTGKVAVFLAGVVSASALLILAVVFRRKQQNT